MLIRRGSAAAALRVLASAVVLCVACEVPPAAAQLHPYEPLEWDLFEANRTASAHFGVAAFADQRASLAGRSGTLLELGRVAGAVRTGRVVLTARGTAYRTLRDSDPFEDPYGGATPSDPIGDVGDFLIDTAVRLTRDDAPVTAILRFGARLPTTDNRIGLERDATDFYAFIGGATDRAALRATAEVGVGIHGTRESAYEQSDVLVYLLGLELRESPGRPSILLLGHADGLSDRAVRGNEELAQLRLRLRSPGDLWVQGELSRGLTPFSGTWGVVATVGRSW